MNGVDLICFTAGLGENSGPARARILDYLTFMGVKVDQEANMAASGVNARISADDSRVMVYAVPTNEELAIARETVALL